MNAQTVNQTFDLVAEVSKYVELHKSGAYHIGACPMCGGTDRFNIKQDGGFWWICRQCGDGKYHTPIDFVMQKNNLSFKDALRAMEGDVVITSQPKREKVEPQERTLILAPDQTWQERAWKLVDNASDRLLDDREGLDGRAYLLGRGISLGSMYRWQLGFFETVVVKGRAWRRPAISIPHKISERCIVGIKYRFLDDKEPRYLFEEGSIPHLFGLQHRLDSDDTLLFVEGELNAISIAQMLPKGVTAISSGSEIVGDETLYLLGKLARKYQRAAIWMDRSQKVIKVRDGIQRQDALLWQSKQINGVKWDANQFLSAGLLESYLTRKLSVERLGVPSSNIKGAG